MIATSIKPDSEILAWPPKWIPSAISFSSYAKAAALLPIARFFLNSVVIAVLTVLTNVVFCSLAAYTLARKHFRGANAIFMLILTSMMIPLHIRVIPMYLLSVNLGLQNTYAGIVLPISITGFGIFLMRQFFVTLPKEVENAARVDGSGEWSTLFRIVLPMSRPAITSLAIFAFTWSIEDFLWPLIITTEVNMRPLPVGITLFLGLEIYEWGPIMATAAIAILPVIIIYLFFQRYFIQGMTAGAVKG